MRLDDKAVKELAIRNDLNGEAIANAVGVSRQSYYGWISHTTTPTLENLGHLVRVLNCTPNDILIWRTNGTDDEAPTGW